MIKKLRGMLLSILVLLVFTIIFVLKGNYEFLTYTFTIGILIWAIIASDKIFNYHYLAKLGFAVWLFLHFLGGSLRLGNMRLYDFILINLVGEPLNIFRYDQFMHVFCYFVFAFFVYAIVSHYLKEKSSKWALFLIVVMIAEGIGGLNEIIELITVIFFNSSGVGNYYNNALDLVFNLVGAVIGAWVAIKSRRKL
jgi:VanZ family protein